MRTVLRTLVALIVLGHGLALAQPRQGPAVPRPLPSRPVVPAVSADARYTIGPEDVLGIVFWRDQEMSGDVTVRPDGMVTLPLVRDVMAAGLTPGELADRIEEAVREYVTDASVTVVVKQMNSRKAFITGEVARPGAYSLGSSSTTVMQLIALAGGLTEFADPRNISIMRVENGRTRTWPFDYRDVARGRKPGQNLLLKPGDTIVVPEK